MTGKIINDGGPVDRAHTPGLLPCPFCGGEASDSGYQYFGKPLRDTHWEDGSEITEAYFCNCPSCGVSNMCSSVGHQTRAEAVAAWNCRAPASPKLKG